MKKRGAAYRRMLWSFVAVFSLPLCLTILFYFYSDRVMQTQTGQADQSLLSAIAGACDRELSHYQSVMDWHFGSETVRELADRTELTDSDRVLEHQLKEHLSQTMVSAVQAKTGEQAVFVCFPGLDLVYVASQDGTVTQHSMESYFGADAGRINGEAGFSAQQVPAAWSTDAMFLTRSDGRTATVGILIDAHALSAQFGDLPLENGYDWLLLDDRNQIVRGDGKFASDGGILDPARLPERRGTVDSRFGGWTYVLLNTGSSFNSASQIRLFFVVGLAICTLIGWFIMEKIVLINYAPVQELMQPFGGKRSGRKNNEFQFLQEQINTLLTRQTDMQNTISRSKGTMRKWYLSMMLAKPFVRQQADAQWESLAESFAGRQNMVLLLRPKPQPEANPLTAQDEEMRQFIIENVFTEKVGESFTCFMTRIDGYQAMAVTDADLSGQTQKLWEIIYDTQAIILENFQFQPVVAGGGIHTGTEGLHASYLEAREAEEFVPVLEQDCVPYDSIRDNTLRKYGYSIQAESRILSALQSGNAELAVAFIDKILEQNFGSNGASSNMRRCLLSDLYCTLLKAADEKDCMERIVFSYNSFSIEQRLEDLQQKYALIVHSICQDQQDAPQAGAEKELCMRVLEYIRQNYSDPKLNISQTALHFRMSPTTLSTIYKNEMGKSLLKTINRVRVEHGTELLQQGCAVNETAERVGFSDTSTFIRIYRREMGVTPGQMKSHIKTEE